MPARTAPAAKKTIAKKTIAKKAAAKKPAAGKTATKGAKAAKSTKPTKAPPAAKTAGSRVQANFYELRSGRTRLTYTESNIAGQPVLTYKDLSFMGDEIQQDPQAIGLLVTVVLKAVPDAYSDLLTVLIPRVNLTNGAAKVATEVIFTRVRTSIGGPNLVNGQVQTYTTKTFTGTASFIVS